MALRRVEEREEPKFVGLLTGAVAGLATITPAAGYVPIYAAVIIGIVAGRRLLLRGRAQEPAALGRRARRLGRARRGRLPGHRPARRVRQHGVNPAGADGLIHGGGAFFGKQVAAVSAARSAPSLSRSACSRRSTGSRRCGSATRTRSGPRRGAARRDGLPRCAARARACSGPRPRPCRRRGQHELVIGDPIAQGTGSRPLRDRASPALRLLDGRDGALRASVTRLWEGCPARISAGGLLPVRRPYQTGRARPLTSSRPPPTPRTASAPGGRLDVGVTQVGAQLVLDAVARRERGPPDAAAALRQGEDLGSPVPGGGTCSTKPSTPSRRPP